MQLLTSLPTIPDSSIIEYQKTVQFSDISTPALTFSLTLVGIPANYVVCGTGIQVLTPFAGSTLSSLTCSLAAFVPNTILSDLTYYGMQFELTQLSTPTSFQLSGSPNNDLTNFTNYSHATGLYFNGPHDVAAYFTAIGTNLNNLTSGTIELVVLIKPL